MVRKFFTDLDLKIGAGATPASLRAFIAPFSEQFEALETQAKSGVSRLKYQEAEAEIERLKALLQEHTENANSQLEGYQAQLQQMDIEREELKRRIAVLERLPAPEEQSDSGKTPERLPDLPELQDGLLKLLSQANPEIGALEADLAVDLGKNFAINATVTKVELTLKQMEEDQFVIHDRLPYVYTVYWFILDKGRQYLVERDRL